MALHISSTFSGNGLIINENILAVEKISIHLQLQIVDNQLNLTEGGDRWHRIGGSLQYAVCQSVAKQYGPYKIYCFIIH